MDLKYNLEFKSLLKYSGSDKASVILNEMVNFYNSILGVLGDVLDSGRKCKVRINGEFCFYEDLSDKFKSMVRDDYKSIMELPGKGYDNELVIKVSEVLEKLELKSREYCSVHCQDISDREFYFQVVVE